jgi:DNA processing protein
MAKRLAEDLANSGYSICSGMAMGIDSESHIGALDNQGVSVAVLGCGIDRIYPQSNKNLVRQLAQQGALVSEFSLGTSPKPWHFPKRNRIISGLSQGVVVVEAALQSGSLITARYALEQGREVFAVPGSPHNPQAKGSHYLLKNGAKLVENAADIIEELGAFIELEREQLSSKVKETKHLNKTEQALLKHIDYEVTNVDLLIHQTGINAGLISSMLIELELEGLIISRQGGYSLSPA